MTVIAILGVFAGILLGLRSRVFAVVPLAVTGSIATFLTLVLLGETSLSAAVACVAGVIALQLGYLCASFAATQQEAPAPDSVATARAVHTGASQPATISDR